MFADCTGCPDFGPIKTVVSAEELMVWVFVALVAGAIVGVHIGGKLWRR